MSSTTLSPPIELQNRISLTSRAPSFVASEAPLPELLVENRNHMNFESEQQNLEPQDRGLAAWRLLCVAFVFEALLWGK